MENLLIRELVKKTLSRFDKYDWTVQGFGMFRLYMDHNIRLTLWHRKFRTENVSQIHTHPWSFESYVVCGQVTNLRFAEGVVSQSSLWRPFYRAQIKAGEGGGLIGEPEEVFLRQEAPEFVLPGEVYMQHQDEIHLSDPRDGTITLCKRTVPEGANPDNALVYWERWNKWVSAEPRPAHRDEVEFAVDAALLQFKRLEAEGPFQ